MTPAEEAVQKAPEQERLGTHQGLKGRTLRGYDGPLEKWPVSVPKYMGDVLWDVAKSLDHEAFKERDRILEEEGKRQGTTGKGGAKRRKALPTRINKSDLIRQCLNLGYQELLFRNSVTWLKRGISWEIVSQRTCMNPALVMQMARERNIDLPDPGPLTWPEPATTLKDALARAAAAEARAKELQAKLDLVEAGPPPLVPPPATMDDRFLH